MNAVSFDPFAIDTERFAVVVGLVVFLATASVLAHRFDDRLESWSSMTALAGLGWARLGHVLQHLDSFASEPWRVLAVWQGGFSSWRDLPRQSRTAGSGTQKKEQSNDRP